MPPPDKFNEAVKRLQDATAADARGKKGDDAMKLQAAVLYTEVLPLLLDLSQRESRMSIMLSGADTFL